VDNLLEVELLTVPANGSVAHVVANANSHSDLYWALRGGGGGTWGAILSMTVKAHLIPAGGVNRVFAVQNGTFCPDNRPFGYEWLRTMWKQFAAWNAELNYKVSTQPGFFPSTAGYKTSGLCGVTWTFQVEYIYSGSTSDPEYTQYKNDLLALLGLGKTDVLETHFNNAWDYIYWMQTSTNPYAGLGLFTLNGANPLPPGTYPPSDSATGSQSSVFVSRDNMIAKFPETILAVLDICVSTLQVNDMTSPSGDGLRCGFHYLYTSLAGNIGSPSAPSPTAINPQMRSALMLWNARTLTTQQMYDTIYSVTNATYFSESPYVLHNWTAMYWGSNYAPLLAIKKAYDPLGVFWCHHCIGDNPNNAYGRRW